MKRLFYILTTVIMLGAVGVNPASAKEQAKQLTAQQQAQLDQIKQRVEEIKAMDKSTLTRQERKELRTEVKAMKKQANAIAGGGVYLSVGAIIIILLILILIL